MKVFLTGGTGFIGGHVAQRLRKRGDDVTTLVRNPAKAIALEGLGCQLIQGDLNDRLPIDIAVAEADLVIHLAARRQIGIPKAEWPKMQDTNVGGVRKVLDAAIEANAKRILYVSTVDVFGNTRGAIVDEQYQRVGADFLSFYDESKFVAETIAKNRIAKGAPVIIVRPGNVYGPGDESEIGTQIRQAADGTLSSMMFPDLGLTMSYIDDVVTGMLSAAERGQVGESYILGGATVRLSELLTEAARLGGYPPPLTGLPNGLVKALAPLGPWLGPKLGLAPNLREVVKANVGVTHWAKSDKAIQDLGYLPRPLESGLRETLAAARIPVKV